MKHRSWTVAFLATVLVFVWQASTVHFNYAGNWTGLFCTGSTLPVPPELDTGSFRSVHPIGYDGQMYRYIAHDPFFRKGYSQYVDDAQLRYRRIFVPLAAYALAGGRQSIIDYSFVLVVLLSVFAGCYWSCRYSVLHRRSEWWGFVFLLVPATITSIDRMLIDGTLAALFAGFLLFTERRDWRSLFVVCTLAVLTRDTGIFLPAAVILAALLQRDFKRAVLFGVSVLPAAGWAVFVARHTPPSMAYQIVTYPLLGHLQRFLVFRPEAILRVTDVVALVAFLICLGLAVYSLLPERFREIQICIGLFVILGLVLGAPSHLIEPYGYARPVSPLLLFLMLRGAPFGLVAPFALTLAVGVNLASQVLGVARGLLR